MIQLLIREKRLRYGEINASDRDLSASHTIINIRKADQTLLDLPAIQNRQHLLDHRQDTVGDKNAYLQKSAAPGNF